jgi:glutamate carboxypeptidase
VPPAAYLSRLRQLVGIDSPTGHSVGVDACARLLAAWAAAAGADVELVPSPDGLHLIASTTGAGSGRTLLIGHHDTVFPVGTALARPVTVDGDIARGPGVADMKGGLLVGLAALERLAARPDGPHGRVELHSVPDEEARLTPPRTLDRMRGAGTAICLECGRASGAIVSRRKAGTWVALRARGRAAHAGTERERGRSALMALAREALRIEAVVHAARPGVSATVTQLHAGDVKNTVPDRAWATVDLRAATTADVAWAMAEIGRFGAHDGVELERSDDPGFPPLVRADALVERTLAILCELGEPALEETAGGVSDGSWASHVGVATVDGLGPVGALDHSADEYIDLRSVAGRIETVVQLCNADRPAPG